MPVVKEPFFVYPLDLDHIAALNDTLGRDRLLILFDRFAVDTVRFVETIEAARETGDVRSLAEAAHRLAGMAALFGGVALTEAARAVESAACDLGTTPAGEQLRQTADQTLSALRTHLGLTAPPRSMSRSDGII